MTAHQISQPTSPRRFTASRIVALALIALVTGAIAALHILGGGSSVSLPHGAKAGELRLHACTYSTEAGKLPADCGTFVVPENRTDPDSRLIALSVKRVRAETPHPAAPIFYMQGGPGITNMDFPMASRFTPNHDVVLLGYRGVDSSTKLDCPEVTSALTGVDDLVSKSTMRAYSDAYRACANRLTDDGVDLLGYNSVERVDDFEAARKAFGYGPINLISESAGTRTAMIYAWRYPTSINRSVMLGVNPPGHYLFDGPTTDAEIEHYAKLCAADAACRSRTGDLAAAMRQVAQHTPGRWGPFAIKSGNVKIAAFFGLVHATSNAAPLSSPQTIHAWQSAAHGNASGLWLESVFGDLFLPTSHVWGDGPATAQLDYQMASAYYSAGGDHGSILGNAVTDHLWGGGGLVSAWPHASEVDQYTTLRPTDVPTLIVSGDLDFATPAKFATEMLQSLHNGDQVILRNLGHTADTWNYDKAGIGRLVNTYFDTGRVDRHAVKSRAMSFSTGMTHERLAVIVVSVLAGLAGLTILMLVWLPLRLSRRGFVGRKTSAFARSVLAPLAGLGGWACAALLVFSVWPSLSVANQPMVIAAVAAPIAAVVYVAWVRRDRTGMNSQTALCAAAGGAAVGAWLGLHASGGLFSLLTAVIGASLGANLAVLVGDLVRGTAAKVPARPVDAEPVLAALTGVNR